MDAMRGLLPVNPDPVDDAVGAFHQPELARPFEILVAAGERSEVGALWVAAELEELDIADLDRALADTKDLRSVGLRRAASGLVQSPQRVHPRPRAARP